VPPLLLLLLPMLVLVALQVMIWRDKQHLQVEINLVVPAQLVPVHSHDVKPCYFIYAGLVFTPLTAAYLKSQYGAVSAPPTCCLSRVVYVLCAAVCPPRHARARCLGPCWALPRLCAAARCACRCPAQLAAPGGW
jgi:hypothetical protein